MSHIIIVGNGMAGSRLAAELHTGNADAKTTILGNEPDQAYNRILLSQLLAGKITERDVTLAKTTGRGIDIRTGQEAVAINPTTRTVTIHTGEQLEYDHLVLATGARPIIPPLPGLNPHQLPHRITPFRTLADCRHILTLTHRARTALVLGGGLLGLEAARGLAGLGVQVHLIQATGRLMDQQLDPAASEVLVDTLARYGITTSLDTPATAVAADATGVALALADGRQLTADLLVISCGVRPDIRLADNARLTVGRGIQVDSWLRTSDPHISAIGDCAEVIDRAGQAGGVVSGLVAPAWEQARTVARQLTGDPHARYTPPPTITRLKADGIDLAAMGSLTGGEQLTFADPSRGTYARLAIEAGRLAGAVLVGDNPATGTVIQLFDRGTPVPADRRSLLLGRATGHPGTPAPGTDPASMPDNATICQCNTVTKRQLVDQWRGGARTMEQLVAATHAGTGCGTCRDAVAHLAGWAATTLSPV